MLYSLGRKGFEGYTSTLTTVNILLFFDYPNNGIEFLFESLMNAEIDF
jgi:hypothetical protein